MAPVGGGRSPAEWAFIVGDTREKIVFTGPGFDGVAGQLAGRLDHGPKIVGADAARAMIDAAARAPFSPAGRDDAVLQLYTSGTTGKPKGAVLSNANLFALRKPSADLDMPYTQWKDEIGSAHV